MDDLISRSALIKMLDECVDTVEKQENKSLLFAFGEFIKSAPAIDAVPVVHAKWVDEIEPNAVTSSGKEVHFFRCSACNFTWNNKTAVSHYFKFCPNCGARMDGDEEG